MLTAVSLFTTDPKVYSISNAAPTDILVVKSISGLDPGTDTLYTGEYAGEGGYYQGRRTPERNIVITFLLNPDYENDVEVSDIREILYRDYMEPFANSDEIQLTFIDDRKPPRYITGVTEGINTDMWQKEQTAQVSIRCVDPVLKSNTTVEESGISIVSTTLDYDGTKDTGIRFVVEPQGPSNSIDITLAAEMMTLEGDFDLGDVIEVNTNTRERSIVMNGVDSLFLFKAGSKWLQIRIDGSPFSIDTDAGVGEAVITEYEYRARWRGI